MSNEAIWLKIGDLISARGCEDPYQTAKDICQMVNVNPDIIEEEFLKEQKK